MVGDVYYVRRHSRMKQWYNISEIENGWILKYTHPPKVQGTTVVSSEPREIYAKSMVAILGYIEKVMAGKTD